MWAKYPDLSEEVKSLLEETTREIAGGSSKYHLSSVLSIVEGQIKQIWDRIRHYISWSSGEDVARSRERHAGLRFACGVLVWIQNFPV